MSCTLDMTVRSSGERLVGALLQGVLPLVLIRTSDECVSSSSVIYSEWDLGVAI